MCAEFTPTNGPVCSNSMTTLQSTSGEFSPAQEEFALNESSFSPADETDCSHSDELFFMKPKKLNVHAMQFTSAEDPDFSSADDTVYSPSEELFFMKPKNGGITPMEFTSPDESDFSPADDTSYTPSDEVFFMKPKKLNVPPMEYTLPDKPDFSPVDGHITSADNPDFSAGYYPDFTPLDERPGSPPLNLHVPTSEERPESPPLSLHIPTSEERPESPPLNLYVPTSEERPESPPLNLHIPTVDERPESPPLNLDMTTAEARPESPPLDLYVHTANEQDFSWEKKHNVLEDEMNIFFKDESACPPAKKRRISPSNLQDNANPREVRKELKSMKKKFKKYTQRKIKLQHTVCRAFFAPMRDPAMFLHQRQEIRLLRNLAEEQNRLKSQLNARLSSTVL